MCSSFSNYLPCLWVDQPSLCASSDLQYVLLKTGKMATLSLPSVRKSSRDFELKNNAFPYIISSPNAIGSGATSKVYIGVHKTTGVKVALKRMTKAVQYGSLFMKEELIHRQLSKANHPNIASLYDVDHSKPDEVMFAIEFAKGGDLLDHIPPNHGLPHPEALSFSYQLLSAVAQVHKLGYAHRDIKSENCVLSADKLNLKLIDFGYAVYLHDKCAATQKSGTVPYIAPEIFLHTCNDLAAADVFSAGIVMFTLFTGRFPWSKASYSDLDFMFFVKGKHSPSEEKYWASLDQDVRELLLQMLNPTATKRCTASFARDRLADLLSGVHGQA